MMPKPANICFARPWPNCPRVRVKATTTFACKKQEAAVVSGSRLICRRCACTHVMVRLSGGIEWSGWGHDRLWRCRASVLRVYIYIYVCVCNCVSLVVYYKVLLSITFASMQHPNQLQIPIYIYSYIYINQVYNDLQSRRNTVTLFRRTIYETHFVLSCKCRKSPPLIIL